MQWKQWFTDKEKVPEVAVSKEDNPDSLLGHENLYWAMDDKDE